MLTFLMKNDYILGNLSKKEMTLAWSMTEKRLNICFKINDYVTFYEIKKKQTLEICLSHFLHYLSCTIHQVVIVESNGVDK